MKFLEENIHREITPLTVKDCFLVFERLKNSFDFPIHFHPEYELNFIHNGNGVKRIVGDHVSKIDDLELVLVGPNLFHGWMSNKYKEKNIHEITIQFHDDLLQEKLLSRSVLKPINTMLENATHGIQFSQVTAKKLYPKLKGIVNANGLDSFLLLISLLHSLAISDGQKKLSTYSPVKKNFHNSHKIEIVYDYLHQNFHKKVKVEDVASLLNMTEVTFGRFMKSRTGKTFIEYLNDIRIGFASRWLLEKEIYIAEIAYNSGFNNVSNFNRVFKANKGCTPSEYKKNFEGLKKIF